MIQLIQKIFIVLILFILLCRSGIAEEKMWAGEKANTRFRLLCLQQGEDYRNRGNKSPAENLNSLIQLAKAGLSGKPNVIVFPEYATTGVPYLSPDSIRNTAEQIPGNGALYSLYVDFAKECKKPVIGWMIEKDKDKYYNTAFVINKHGEFVDKYRKVQTNLREQNIWGFAPGNEFKIFEIDSCKIGMSICADMWFPETVMCLALMQADMILHLSVGDDMGWVIPTRARDHFIPIIAAIHVHGSWGVDQWGELIRKGSKFHEYNIFDVFPFRKVITGRLGGWYPQLGRRAYRNPNAYSIITDTTTIPPLSKVFFNPETGKTLTDEELKSKFPRYRGY